jgi:hypothetical protein
MSNVDGWVLGGCSGAVGRVLTGVDGRRSIGLRVGVVAVDDGGCPARLQAWVRTEPGPLGQAASAEPLVLGDVVGAENLDLHETMWARSPRSPLVSPPW